MCKKYVFGFAGSVFIPMIGVGVVNLIVIYFGKMNGIP